MKKLIIVLVKMFGWKLENHCEGNKQVTLNPSYNQLTQYFRLAIHQFTRLKKLILLKTPKTKNRSLKQTNLHHQI